MREKSKALEDKLAQVTEKHAACKRDWDEEVEERRETEGAQHGGSINQPSLMELCAFFCGQQKAVLLERIRRAPHHDLLKQGQGAQVEREVCMKKKKKTTITAFDTCLDSGYTIFRDLRYTIRALQ